MSVRKVNFVMEFDSQKCLLNKLSMQIGLCSFITLLPTKTQTQHFVLLCPTSLAYEPYPHSCLVSFTVMSFLTAVCSWQVHIS